jgi:hypothetical protein
MSGRCPDNERLLNAFGEAVRELLIFQEQHFVALVNGEADPERYELLIHLASEKRQAAKYAYITHLEEHGCERTAASALVEQVAMRSRNDARKPERRKVDDPTRSLKRRLSDLA